MLLPNCVVVYCRRHKERSRPAGEVVLTVRVEFVYFHVPRAYVTRMQIDRLPRPSYIALLLSKMRIVLIDVNDFTFSKIFGYFCVTILAFLMSILVGFKYQFKITKSIAVKTGSITYFQMADWFEETESAGRIYLPISCFENLHVQIHILRLALI